MGMRAGIRVIPQQPKTDEEIILRMHDIKFELGQTAIKRFELWEEYKALNLKLNKS